MSLVIAIRDKDRFILGADKQGSLWNNKEHTATKVWYTEYEGCCIGSVGYARASQIIQYIKGLLDGAGFGRAELDDAFIHLQLPRTLYETLKAHGIIVDDPAQPQPFSLPNTFLIAYKDRCWKIEQDLTVIEVEEYDAIGSGQDIALGVIETSFMYGEKNPYQIIANAIDIAAEKTLYVDHELDFVETGADKKDLANKLAVFGMPKEKIKEVEKAAKSGDKAAMTDIIMNQNKPEDKPTEEAEVNAAEAAIEEKPKKKKSKKAE